MQLTVTILPTRSILLTSSDLDSLATPSLIPALQNTIEVHSTTEILPTTSNVMSTPLVTRRLVPKRSSPQNTIIIATSTYFNSSDNFIHYLIIDSISDYCFNIEKKKEQKELSVSMSSEHCRACEQC